LQFAISNNYTAADAAEVTRPQIENILGKSLGSNFFANLKRVLVRDLLKIKYQQDLEKLRNELIGGGRVWLSNNFPEHEFEKDVVDGKLVIKLWPYGRPEVIDG